MFESSFMFYYQFIICFIMYPLSFIGYLLYYLVLLSHLYLVSYIDLNRIFYNILDFFIWKTPFFVVFVEINMIYFEDCFFVIYLQTHIQFTVLVDCLCKLCMYIAREESFLLFLQCFDSISFSLSLLFKSLVIWVLFHIGILYLVFVFVNQNISSISFMLVYSKVLASLSPSFPLFFLANSLLPFVMLVFEHNVLVLFYFCYYSHLNIFCLCLLSIYIKFLLLILCIYIYIFVILSCSVKSICLYLKE